MNFFFPYCLRNIFNAPQVLQGLQYIHNQLGIVYGELNVKNLLLSFYTCDLKLGGCISSHSEKSLH